MKKSNKKLLQQILKCNYFNLLSQYKNKYFEEKLTSSNKFCSFKYRKEKDFNGLGTQTIFDRKITLFQYHNGNFNAFENFNFLNGSAEKNAPLHYAWKLPFQMMLNKLPTCINDFQHQGFLCLKNSEKSCQYFFYLGYIKEKN